MPVKNSDIADVLEKIGVLLEVEDASPFRIRAYKNAADSIRFFEPPLVDMVERGDDLTELDGIGDAIAKKIEEIVRTGHLAYVDRLEAETGPGVFELLRVPGLGPKRVRVLREALGIRSVEALREALEDGKLREVAGFGAKTEERLLARLRARDDLDDTKGAPRS